MVYSRGEQSHIQNSPGPRKRNREYLTRVYVHTHSFTATFLYPTPIIINTESPNQRSICRQELSLDSLSISNTRGVHARCCLISRLCAIIEGSTRDNSSWWESRILLTQSFLEDISHSTIMYIHSPLDFHIYHNHRDTNKPIDSRSQT